MEEIVLYTIGCPNCIVLEKKLNLKGIKYDVVNDLAVLENLESDLFPQLKVGDKIMDFYTAIEWLRKRG